MPPRHQTLPQAQTASAREAMSSFYCQLCAKGYSRHNEYEAHLSSYDHAHKVRLKEMRAMTRDPGAAARARRAEAKAEGVISIQFGAGQGGGAGGTGGGGSGKSAGFKKGGFKKSGFKSAFAPAGNDVDQGETEKDEEANKIKSAALLGRGAGGTSAAGLAESDTEDEGYEVYDPRFPTD
ncbi:hypothetical protein M406DRAFT_270140 [Cryphonectria parasitica EP155]|uniref:C2H2-type domain-containing protein n=1 Tax=Cryphonectria parasitica (strain ATCC 38755 / EP155) TaxID=660469 RepID=A0A9P4XS34_CRYP1|nr:uncharacterized protein M406DRAFT_270140 [Cryphonectria parasitica EP155]KAF3759988.1 hypothetical protein M406DRAFT_270140 [Cryphonectria parasitica EP155]